MRYERVFERIGERYLMKSPQKVIICNSCCYFITILKRFCHNLEGSFPDRPPSKSKIKCEKKRTIKNQGLEYNIVQITYCAEAQHTMKIFISEIGQHHNIYVMLYVKLLTKWIQSLEKIDTAQVTGKQTKGSRNKVNQGNLTQQ